MIKSLLLSNLMVKGFLVLSAFLAEKRQVQKIGGELVFSADLCYNGDNEKASPLGRGGGEADGEG